GKNAVTDILKILTVSAKKWTVVTLFELSPAPTSTPSTHVQSTRRTHNAQYTRHIHLASTHSTACTQHRAQNDTEATVVVSHISSFLVSSACGHKIRGSEELCEKKSRVPTNASQTTSAAPRRMRTST
ncbi:unnamed protein product, partial [Ectocarpus fasciculatus]